MRVNLKIRDGALPALLGFHRRIKSDWRRAVGQACVRLTREHLDALPPNKNGWPTTNFYRGAARGTYWDLKGGQVVVVIDNEAKPGAMRQRYYGGDIVAKDKMLTIPARAEFYGHSAREFTNLRLVVFGRSGTAALVVGTGGTQRLGQGGKAVKAKGLGTRAQALVAYWLKDRVHQDADESVIPTPQEYQSTALQAAARTVALAKREVAA